jgi:hypothetical protein
MPKLVWPKNEAFVKRFSTSLRTNRKSQVTSPSPTLATTAMGRLHSNGKGISASAIPYSRTPPAWLKTTPEQVVDQICKLAKKGATPSQIGVVLRDSHGIAQVKVVTGMHTTYSDALPILGFRMVANMFLCR